MNKKAVTAVIGAAAIATLASFAATDGTAGSTTTRTTADSGQESKFPTPTPVSPAEVSGAVTTTSVPTVH